MATSTPQLVIPPNNSTLSLLIVAKAKMINGLCYMGYDANTNKLVRPLYSAEKDKQCWPRGNDFFVGEIITVICSYPGQSSLPHSNEDILVSSVVTRSYQPGAMFETLSKLSSPTVEAIFGIQNISEDRGRREGVSFVKEGTTCPSVGIYSCKGASIKLYNDVYDGKVQRRCIINEPLKLYDFSITAEDSYQEPKSDDSLLLLIGLGRPWIKRGQTDQTKRYYMFVIGMITKPSDSNTSQGDQLAPQVDQLSFSTAKHINPGSTLV